LIKKKHLEFLFLLFVFSLLLWMGVAGVYQNKLSHDFPHGFMAMDSFWKLGRAQNLDQTGNQFYAQEHLASDLEGVVETYPPLLATSTVLLHRLSGLEVYDSIFFLTVLFAVFAALVMYLLIRDFNKNLAIIAAGLFGFLFYGSFYIGHIWGRGPLIIGSMFLVTIFWSINKLKLKRSYLLVGFLLAASFLSHPPEFMIAIAFIVFYFVIQLLIKRFNFSELKTTIIAVALSLILSLSYLPIFLIGGGNSGIKLFTVITKSSEPAPYALDFSFFLIFIVIGAIFAILHFIKKKKINVALLVSLFMLLITYSNYLGNAKRAFQNRYFWPIYLSLFFALGIYHLAKIVIKKWKSSYSLIMGVGLLILFLIFFHQPITSPGLANEYNWDAFEWIRAETPENAKLYFFYGDSYGQSSFLSSTFRSSYLVNTDDYVKALNEGKIKQHLLTKEIRMKGKLPYKTGMLSYGSYIDDGVRNYTVEKIEDVCEFDYYIADRGSRYPELANYNILMLNTLIKNEWIEEVYSNSLVVVLKNNNPGADCIGN
jgi:hypothetical protein